MFRAQGYGLRFGVFRFGVVSDLGACGTTVFGFSGRKPTTLFGFLVRTSLSSSSSQSKFGVIATFPRTQGFES